MFAEERIGEILNQLKVLSYPQSVSVQGWKMRHTGEETAYAEAQECDWRILDHQPVWGGDCEYLAFVNTVELPPEFEGNTVEFVLRTGREGEWDATNPQFTVYIDHVLRQGFDVNHESIVLTECAEKGEKHHIFLSAYTGVRNFHLEFSASLRLADRKIQKLYYDLLIPWQIACTLDKEEYSYIMLIEKLTHAINLLDLRRPGSKEYYQSAEEAEDYLRQEFYTEKKETEAQVICVGHTHIDIAWLWTLSVTEDKAVRSFSTVLELMKRYPEYIFMSGQPQLYLYVKKNAPEIYEQIKERVKEGRWEVEGSMFVEPDCNLASGEALVRQILYGKKFFKEEFQHDCQILWLPDVFGYSAALPQILKKSNVKYFMTTKISWNEVNKLPYDSFYWEGIDGSRILTHFITTRDYVSKTRNLKTNNEFTTDFSTNYNGVIHPCQIRGAWQRYQQKNLNREILCSYGYGDGGGGPTEEMLETQRRLSYGIPGCPSTKQGRAIDFFRQMEKTTEGKNVPVWSGELYLEYHRATYTAMARNKRFNRKSEFAVMNLETYSVLAEDLTGMEYPETGIKENWEIIMRNQFHDILPGSSIFQVYEDSKREYEKLFEKVHDDGDQRLQKLADCIGGVVVFNPNGKSMSGLVEMDTDPGFRNIQRTWNGKFLFYVENIPSKGYRRVYESKKTEQWCLVTADAIDTPFVSIVFNENGHITEWLDKKQNRNILKPGQKGNVLVGYEDKPHKYDNWNLFDYYREKSWVVDELLERKVVEAGPFRYALKLVWRYMDSVITEHIYVYPDSPEVDFEFTADWKEDQIFLKALFPLDINSHEAAYEIQYGNVKRPTTCNTSWDHARFEVCYHKWMDISEGGYGISFLNDCKYGVSVEDNTVGLSLIKCGRYPNPKADRELHHAIYSVYPHEGTWEEAEIVKKAYLLNNPMVIRTGESTNGCLPEVYSGAFCGHRNIMIEVFKKSEDGKSSILRLYEFENRRTNAVIMLGRKYRRIWIANLLEEKETLLTEDTDCVSIPVKPFEIVTFVLEQP